jgi:hypothetical protein
MGGTCSCESNDNYNVETYYSVNGSKSYRVKTKADIFEDKIVVKCSIDAVKKKNFVVKIQKSFRKYLSQKIRKNEDIVVRYRNSMKEIAVKNDRKISENSKDIFAKDEKSSPLTYPMSKNRESIIFLDEKLKFLEQIESGIFSKGYLHNNKEGYSLFTLKDSTQIKGIFKFNKLNGFVQIKTKHEEEFLGELTKFSANGFGIYLHNKVVEYEGYWRDNYKHGYGK